MKLASFRRLIDNIFTGLFVILTVGTPLIFTSATRSVFEVNKLLLLRIVEVIVIFLWATKYVVSKSHGYEKESKRGFVTLGWFKWEKTGFETGFSLWLIVNLISTILSKNVFISVIGAYDRWEGIITIANYAVLFFMIAKNVTTKTSFFWIVGAMVASTAVSSVYGVCQSLGWDFMNWSQDPTYRVFGCINNPVHYCAYVSMVVPVGMGLLLFLESAKNRSFYKPLARGFTVFFAGLSLISLVQMVKHGFVTMNIETWVVLLLLSGMFYLCQSNVKWLVFFLTCLIYYSQFLSFSRATWLGFIGVMPLFYMMAVNHLDRRTTKRFAIDFFFTAVSIACLALLNIFELHKITGPEVWGILALVVIGWIAYSFYMLTHQSDIKSPIRVLFARIIIVFIFIKLQFVAVSPLSLLLYGALVGLYFYFGLKQNTSISREKKKWLLLFLVVFGLIIVIPNLPVYKDKILGQQGAKSMAVMRSIELRTSSYKKDADNGTARTSMWKSSIPWIKDNPLFGTGPDTIKYIYPTYRLDDYGILEGGHNFTPDRLHNEYLNTLATRGIFGFLTYYVGIMLVWFLVVLKDIYKKRHDGMRYLSIGFVGSVGIYMGQVLFNFGVVATLVLFYLIMGLAVAASFLKSETNE